MSLLLTIILQTSVLALCAGHESDLPMVKVEGGVLQGTTGTSTEGKEFVAFLGIPFAKPPIGSLRFEDPVEPEEWSGTLHADQIPEPCYQLNSMEILLGQSKEPRVQGTEDCLYLNVYTNEAFNSDANFPVMVFIHGGGFTLGGAKEYGPNVLMNEQIVLVIIQYRLGALGFLSTEDAAMKGNQGLKDQTLALKWVKKNIRNFGGNPDKVTIFGESAGAASVHLQMLSPKSKGLFNGVIAQSGVALCPWATRDDHREFAKDLGEKLGCHLKDGSEKFKECMKKQEAEALTFLAMTASNWGQAPIYTAPRVDGDFLPDYPEVLLKKGKYNKVNFMTGLTRDEGALFVGMMFSDPRMRDNLENDFSTYGPMSLFTDLEKDAVQLAQRIYDRYRTGNDFLKSPNDALVSLFTDQIFTSCHDITANLHAKTKDHNVYLYELHHRGQWSIGDILKMENSEKWISHADDLFYLFYGGLPFSVTMERKEDLQVRETLTKLWTNFASFGNPTPPDSFDFVWKPTTSTNLEFLNITTRPKMQPNYRTEKRKFWKSLDTALNHRLNSAKERKIEL